MKFLKTLPIQYKGELHNIRLVNFTIDKKELDGLVPREIKIRDFDGKAMISMVDVQLKKMRPDFLPSFLHFGYRHIAFRLLVDDSRLNNGDYKGIYFLKSFTDKKHIVLGGKLLTEYNLERARIEERIDSVKIIQGNNIIHYQRDDKESKGGNQIKELQEKIGAIDRAYSVVDGKLRVTQIVREKWPIEPVDCAFFETSFFKTASLQGVFRVNEVIYYDWLPSRATESNRISVEKEVKNALSI